MSLPKDLRSEYPFEPKSLSIDGHRYSYVDEGKGPVLLFVHGNPSWSFAWRNLIKGLSNKYRCIAVDHLGMGLSDKPNNYEYTLEQHINNLSTLIKELDLREIRLIGHDWGGCIGMGAAGRDPSRFKKFVMMNTAAFRSRLIPFRIAICRIPYLGAIGVRGLNGFAAAAITQAVVKPMSPKVKKGYLYPYDSWDNRQAVHRFVQDIPLESSHESYQTLANVEESLEQFINHPMLLFWGEKDWCFTTDFLEEWEARFPHSETVRYADASHYVFEDAYERMLPKLRKFLKS